MTEPMWIVEARKWIGLAEIPGKATAPVIARWLRELGAWWSDDATPWCGTFAAHCMKVAGSTPPRAFYRAKVWADWGIELEKPLVGCVAVFERQGGGHVGFVVGRYPPIGLSCLGGNQDNEVNVSVISKEPIAYRWPQEFAHLMADYDRVLPVVPALRSRSEA